MEAVCTLLVSSHGLLRAHSGWGEISWLQFRQSEFGSCSRSSVGAGLYTVGGVPPKPSIRALPTCNRTWHGVWVSCSELLLFPFTFPWWGCGHSGVEDRTSQWCWVQRSHSMASILARLTWPLHPQGRMRSWHPYWKDASHAARQCRTRCVKVEAFHPRRRPPRHLHPRPTTSTPGHPPPSHRRHHQAGLMTLCAPASNQAWRLVWVRGPPACMIRARLWARCPTLSVRSVHAP